MFRSRSSEFRRSRKSRRHKNRDSPQKSCLRQTSSSLHSFSDSTYNSSVTVDTNKGAASERVVSVRVLPARKVSFAEEPEVFMINYDKVNGIKRLICRNKEVFDPNQIWWSPQELLRAKNRNGVIGPVEHAHLMNSLRTFRNLKKTAFARWASLKDDGEQIPWASSVSDDDNEDCDSELDDQSVSQAASSLLQDDLGEEASELDDNSYLNCRGLDNWGKQSGTTKEYMQEIIAFYKQLCEEGVDKDVLIKRLGEKSRELSRHSRQWAYTLGQVDRRLATEED